MTNDKPLKLSDKDIFTPEEVGEILNVSAYTVVNKYIRGGKGTLKAYRLGHKAHKRTTDKRPWRIWRDDLIAFINQSNSIVKEK